MASTALETGVAGARLPRGRVVPLLAFALALIALLLPPTRTAILLVGASSALLAQVVTGTWIFKACLLLHAVLLFWGSRLSLTSSPRGVLAAMGVEEKPGTRTEVWSVGALLAFALVVRLWDLGAGLWFDEIRALLAYGRMPFGQIVATYDSQNQHLLYSLFARATLLVFGESSSALRLPAVLFGVASLGAVYWFGSQVAARREALFATALLTFSYHHVWFSQNARGYTALLLLTLLSTALLLKLLTQETRGWSSAIAYAVVTALAVFTHVTAVLVVAAQFLIWLVLVARARNRGLGRAAWLPLAGFVLAGTIALQLYALALPQFLQTLAKSTGNGVAIEWKNPLWFLAETVRGLSQGIPGGYVALGGATLVGLTGVVSYWRQSPTVAAAMLLPGVVTAAALMVLEHNLWPRFFFFCAGFAVLIAIRGVFVLASVAGRRGRVVAQVALSAVVLASATTLPRAWAPKQDYAGAQAYIERVRAAGDAVVAIDLAAFPFEEYLHTGWQRANTNAELEEIERTHKKTYVLYTFPARLSALQPEMWERLQRQYSTASEFDGTVGGGAIIVKVRS